MGWTGHYPVHTTSVRPITVLDISPESPHQGFCCFLRSLIHPHPPPLPPVRPVAWVLTASAQAKCYALAQNKTTSSKFSHVVAACAGHSPLCSPDCPRLLTCEGWVACQVLTNLGQGLGGKGMRVSSRLWAQVSTKLGRFSLDYWLVLQVYDEAGKLVADTKKVVSLLAMRVSALTPRLAARARSVFITPPISPRATCRQCLSGLHHV